MFGFKQKKPAKNEERNEEETAPEPVAEPVAEPLTGSSPVPTPTDLPLDGVVPDPPETDEPDPLEATVPTLDFSAPAAGAGDDGGGDSTSLANLFGGTEDQNDNSLGPILDMAPQASIEEVMEGLYEIKDMLRGRIDEQ